MEQDTPQPPTSHQTSQFGFREFKDKEQRAEEAKWETAFTVILDVDGRVIVNNQVSFIDTKRPSTEQDAIHMLRTALQEFETERLTKIVVAELGKMIK